MKFNLKKMLPLDLGKIVDDFVMILVANNCKTQSSFINRLMMKTKLFL